MVSHLGAVHPIWIAHVTAWGRGEQAVLDYLARYVFRIAITNARIVGLDDAGVTFAYRDRKTGRRRICRLSGEAFMRRFLQHVLPRGFHKVRYFGLWHQAHRQDAARVRKRCAGITLRISREVGSAVVLEKGRQDAGRGVGS